MGCLSGGLGVGRLLEGREGSGVPLGGQERGREALPKGRQQLEALLEGWYGSGGPARGWEA